MPYKARVFAVLALFAASSSLHSQPPTCENAVPAFTNASRDQAVARITTAKKYFMESPDPAAGGSYTERMAKFDSVAVAELRRYRDQRTAAYQATVCEYSATRSTSGRGARSVTTINTLPGQYFVTSTLERTQNGDWKGGPSWEGNPDYPTAMSWVTGGYQPATTSVRIKGRYSPDHIGRSVASELASIRQALADANVPTLDP
ncbi:MAG TPA: hypothetical protein VF665_24725 [Longimicrobium sp.]|jgi:hypothetical protein|uniref:hypothetical protein n=1 Tax=Longimicrobium sp. TaxID=2029185 RepID=UPI002ED9410B